MQKSKTKQIYNIYKRYYTCSNGHSLVWKGGVYIFTNTPCFKCKKNYTENNITIRWSCEECKEYYCQTCFNIIVDNYCPSGDKLFYINKLGNLNFSEYKCDKCEKHKKVIDGLFYDEKCNYTICPSCNENSHDIPDILED